jgi:hypothetical protein
MLAASLVLAAAGMAAPRDVVADYTDNGVVDRCYTDAEFEGALDLVRADQEQYGAAREVLETRQAECTTAAAGGGTLDGEDDGGGGSTLLWIVLAVVGVAVLGGGVAAAGRRRGAGR